MSDELEIRCCQLELRASGRMLAGYAALYGVEAQIGSFRESIAPGAFTRSLAAGRDILCLSDHQQSKVLARTRNGSLKLASDARGLAFEAEVANTSYANDVLELVRSGMAGGCSFGFQTVAEDWRGKVRVLKDVELHEVSIVSSHAAYPETTVTARSITGRFPRRRVLWARQYLETLR